MSGPLTKYKAVMSAVRKQYPGLVILSSAVNLLLLVTAIYMLQIYDRVLSSGSLDTLLWLTVIALFAIAIYGVLEQSRRIILARTAGHIDSELNAPVLRRAMQARLTGVEAQAGVKDVSDLRNFYNSDAVLAFLDAPWSLVFLVFIWSLHPMLGFVATVGAVVLFCATLVNDLMTRKRQRAATAEARSANEAAIRYVEGGETIGTLGMTDAIFSRWQLRQDRARNAQQNLGEVTTTILSFTRSFRLGLQVVVLGTGAYFVLAGDITGGAMIAASIIMGRAMAPIERSTAAWGRYVAASTAHRRLDSLFQTLEAEPEKIRLPRPNGKLEVENVFFSAPTTGATLLKGIQFALTSGETCVVIGASGAGKSTLCRLIVGAWAPSNGAVRLDGADVSLCESEDLGRQIGYLPQKVELFEGTVAENIARFGDMNSETIIKATTLAGAHDMILRLPDGYETDVGLHADRLPQGQRQRIGLARALFGDPPLMVLDEPNSNLDRAGDMALLTALRALHEAGRTVVVVTHRPEILKSADKLLVLREGAIENFGPCEDLLRPVPQDGKQQMPSSNIPATTGKLTTGRVAAKSMQGIARKVVTPSGKDEDHVG